MHASDLRNYLIENQKIKDLVNTRVYPGWIPKNATVPAITYFEVSGVRHHDIDVAYPRYQFSVFSSRYSEAREIAKEIRDTFQRYKGKLGSTSIIQGVFENEYEQYENETKLYHIALDFKFIYWE